MANSEIREHAICVLFEGISVAFWTRKDAAAAIDVERASTHVGLAMPDALPAGFSLTDGHLTSGVVRFRLSDVDDTLADLFAAERSDTEALTSAIEPGDTVSNSATQTLRSRHVGTEYIGSSGERRQYPAFRDFSVGMRHPKESEAVALGLGASPVTASPLLFAGRRVAVYEFLLIDGTWQTWDESALIWWGTVRGTGQTKGREWSIHCNGADSLLRKNLGYSAWSEPVAVDDAEILFEDNETTVHVAMIMVDYSAGSGDVFLRSYGTDSQTIGGDTVADVRTALNTALNTARDAEGDSGQFSGSDNPGAVNEEPGGTLALDTNSSTIGISIKTLASYRREGIALVTMCEKAWRSFGYDPQIQGDEALLNGSDPDRYVDFVVSTGASGAPSGLPYYTAKMSTRPVQAILDGQAGNSDADNGGDVRYWNALYGNGEDETYTLYAAGNQEVYLAYVDGELYLRGQHDVPVADDPESPGVAYTFSGGGQVDSTRLFAFFGPRRSEGGEEYDEVWVGRCSWLDSNGQISRQDPDNDLPALYVSQWLDPQLFGFPPVNTGGASYLTDWSAPKGTIRAVPLHHLTHTADGYKDNPVRVARNMLVATGTSGGWFTDITYSSQQFGFGGKLQPGANNPNGLTALRPADGEIEDLGLCIPKALVMSMQTALALEQSLPDGLNSCKLTYAGRFAAEQALKGLTRPLGLCWSLRGGKYTIFDPAAPISPSDVDHVITVESYHAEKPSDGIQAQALTLHSPIDRLTVRYAQNPIDQTLTQEATLRATDAGSRYRAQDVPLEIEAPGYSGGFGAGLLNRWRVMFDFWGRRHYHIQGVELHYDATIWPGDTVQWTDAALVSVDGMYGVTNALGYIVKRVHMPGRGVTVVDAVLVQAGGDGARKVAPSARVMAYDSGGPTLTCAKDHRYISKGGFDWNDLTPFDDGASIEVKQYDGNTWTTAGYGVIDSVDADSNTITLTGALSGGTGYYRDRDSIVVYREHSNQASSTVLDTYAPVADDTGEVNGDAADAVKWSG